jgi:hypothetical protein
MSRTASRASTCRRWCSKTRHSPSAQPLPESTAGAEASRVLTHLHDGYNLRCGLGLSKNHLWQACARKVDASVPNGEVVSAVERQTLQHKEAERQALSSRQHGARTRALGALVVDLGELIDLLVRARALHNLHRIRSAELPRADALPAHKTRIAPPRSALRLPARTSGNARQPTLTTERVQHPSPAALCSWPPGCQQPARQPLRRAGDDLPSPNKRPREPSSLPPPPPPHWPARIPSPVGTNGCTLQGVSLWRGLTGWPGGRTARAWSTSARPSLGSATPAAASPSSAAPAVTEAGAEPHGSAVWGENTATTPPPPILLH